MKSLAAIKRQIDKLRAQIAELDRLYYQENRPAMADMEYDLLRKSLEKLEQEHPELAAAPMLSPTKTVGNDKTGKFPTARHVAPMLSLENTYTHAELVGFDERLKRALEMPVDEKLNYIVEPKIDGVSISVVYENGVLVRAVTRGDGEEGDVVTENFKTIIGVPHQLPPGMPSIVELRGEVYLAFEKFDEINAEAQAAGQEPYANPRNLAAGTLKLKDNEAEVRRRGLQVIFYTVGAGKDDFFSHQSELLKFFAKHHFPTHAQWWAAAGIGQVWQKIEALDNLRKTFPYATDGAVIKLDDIALQTRAGHTARAPRWAFAYKYAPERTETLLKKITLQVGRTGVLTPVAELEPVELSGSVVARATLHNADEIARKDIREGDTVLIEKAGEVIPAVIEVVMSKRPAHSKPFIFPQSCPSCASGVVRAPGEVAWRCVNPQCPEQLRRALQHFASRNAMAIDGLGEAVVDQLVARGLVKKLSDIYFLRVDDFLTLEGFAEKSAENLYAALQASRRNDLWRLIHGLGIPQVGETVSQLLARELGSLTNLSQASIESLQNIRGIGESMAQSIVDYFATAAHAEMLKELSKASVNTQASAGVVTQGPLLGQKFVLTGELPGLTRTQAKEKLESLGASVIDSVSKNITAVIAGEKAGSKLEKAQSLQIKIMYAEEFRKFLSFYNIQL